MAALITAWERPFVAAGTFVALVAFLLYAWRRDRLGVVFAAVTVLLAALWTLAAVAVRADYRGADGYVDCWPHCSVFQDTVALAIWFGPAVLVALAVAFGLLATITKHRVKHRMQAEESRW